MRVMKGFKNKMSWIWNTLCGVSSVVSLGLLIFGNEHAVIIALSVFGITGKSMCLGIDIRQSEQEVFNI